MKHIYLSILLFFTTAALFAQAPTIIGFTPITASTGQLITITGTNFTGATSVSAGGTAVIKFKIVSATTIIAQIFTGSSGSVTVTNAFGPASLGGFTFIPKPDISYTGPQVYNINTAIPTLAPTNIGGAVPANIYGQVSPYAGTGNIGSTNGLVGNASFNHPTRLSTDFLGDQYVADRDNDLIRKISGGSVTTFAAGMNQPNGTTVDLSGNVYVADAQSNSIKKITPAGAVTTFAGNGTQGAADGTGAAATFYNPYGVFADPAGNLIVADTRNNLVRKITTAAVVTTFAGNGSTGFANGTGTAAVFNGVGYAALDLAGNVYVCDGFNALIRKITPAAVVTTYAGTGVSGLANGTTTTAMFNRPAGLAIDPLNNFYITDLSNNQVRKIDAAGNVTTLAGSSVAGSANGVGAAAGFNQPNDVQYEPSGNLLVTDYGNSLIRKISITGYTIDKSLPAGLSFDATTGKITGTPTATSPSTNYTITAYNTSGSSTAIVNITVSGTLAPNISYQTPQVYTLGTTIPNLAPTNTGGAVPATIYGQVTTVAGSGSVGSNNATGTAASFSNPYNATIDALGNLYIADCNNHMIRKVTTPGAVVTTLAGSAGSAGSTDGTGAAARFFNPGGITVDAAGNVYVGDQNNNLVRKITPAGVVTTLAGTGAAGLNNGTALSATFAGPAGLAFDSQGNLFVADRLNNVVRKITTAGIVTTFASGFNNPTSIAIDASDNLFVTDQNNNLIRKITPAGTVTTFAGSGAQGSADGASGVASFYRPFSLAFDISGNLYIADEFNHLIRQVGPTGVVTTLAGSGTAGGTNGIGKAASFNYPGGVTSDYNGNLYVTETIGQRIRKIIITGYVIDKALPAGLVFDQTTGIISGTPTVLSPATNYTITAYNKGGSSSFVVNISVTNPQVVLSPIPNKIVCDADFTPTTTGGTGTITFTSSNTAVATIVAGKVHITGLGTTTITATDGSTSSQQTLTVKQAVTPLVTVTPTTTSICAGSSATFNATITNNISTVKYQWQLNGVNAGTNSATFTTPITSSADKVQCIVTRTDSCFVSGSSNTYTGMVINANITPSVNISVSPTGIVCPGTALTFTATPTNGGTAPAYQWQVNGVNAAGTASTFTSSTLATGDLVTCVLTNTTNPCVTTTTATSNADTVNLIPATAHIVTVTSSANNVYTGTTITFAATITNATTAPTYKWLVNGTTQGVTTATFTTNFLKNGAKVSCIITVTDQCGASSTEGSFTIALLPRPAPIIYNTFTPNGDSNNDVWNIKNLDLYSNCQVKVYTRNGALVFWSTGYTAPWDGNYNNKPLPVGTYYYVIDLNDGSPKLAGPISILR